MGSGIGQSVLRSLSFSDLDYRVVGMDVSAYNSGIHWVDRAHLIPRVKDADRYLDRVLEICKAEQVDVLIPGLDPELPILAGAAERFGAVGSHVLASSSRTVLLTGDKQATHDWCSERGLPFVPTLTLPDAQNRATDLEYPVVVKPRAGSASSGAQLVASADQLWKRTEGDDWIVQSYLPPRGLDLVERGTNGLLEQTNEVSAQYIIGQDGAILGEFVSLNVLKAGIPIEIVPISDEPWVHDGRQIAEAMVAEGARGPLNLQGRLTSEGRVKFFEFNARFTGITGVRAMMGFREVEAAIRSLVLGDEAGAREALRFDPRYVGLRHVGDMVVPAERVDTLVAERRYPTSDGNATSAQRVLVTGASGYVGGATISALAETGAASVIEALARNAPTGEIATPTHAERRAIREGDLLDGQLDLSGIDTIVHLAAARPVGTTSEAEIYRVNVEGTRRLLVAARDAGVRRVIHLSTQAVYGTARAPLWVENFEPQPDTAYGTSKWLAEELCHAPICGDMQLVILRAARVFGLAPRVRWDELPHNFARLSVANRPLEVHGEGSQRMDLLHVRDLATAIAAAATAELPPGSRTVLNIGGGHPVSLNELAALYPAEVSRVPRTGPLPPSFGMDIRRARALLGWTPRVSLREAVDELLDAARADVSTPR